MRRGDAGKGVHRGPCGGPWWSARHGGNGGCGGGGCPLDGSRRRVLDDVHPEVAGEPRQPVRVTLAQRPKLPAAATPVDLREQQHGLLPGARRGEAGDRTAAGVGDLECRCGQPAQGNARVGGADDHRDPRRPGAQARRVDGQRVAVEPGAWRGRLVVEHEVGVAPDLAAVVGDERAHVEGAGHPDGHAAAREGQIAPGNQLAHRAVLVGASRSGGDVR